MKVVSIPYGWSEQTTNRSRPSSQRPATLTKVPSLLFDIELEERAARANPAVNDASAMVLSRLTKLVEPRTHLEDIILETWEDQASGEADCSVQLEAMAAHLRQSGCSADIQVAAGGGAASECLRNLRHTFLTYSATGLNRETGVFDPAFREQFEISRPSPAYQGLLAAVPTAFVGSEERLTATVRLLCKELQAEFAEKGVTLPPWRDVQAMLTKWRPSAGPSARASMGSAPVPRPAPHQAAAAQLLQPPAAVKHDFFLGHGCTATLSPAPRGKGSKQQEDGRTLYQRMAQPVYEGFQRVNRNYAANLLSSGL